MHRFPFISMPTIGISNLVHRTAYAKAKRLLLFAFVATITACASGEVYAPNNPKVCLAIQEVRCPRDHAQYVDQIGCTACIYIPDLFER